MIRVMMNVLVTVVTMMMSVMVVVYVAIGADAAHVVVMADLRRALILFVAEHLLPILAEQAVHQVGAVQRFAEPLDEGVDNQGMVVQILGLDDLDLRMRRLAGFGVRVDSLDQDSGEQEVREDDDPPIAEPDGVPQPLVDQRVGDPGIAHLRPAEAHALPQHSRHLGDVGVGVGIVGAAPDHHQQRLAARHL